MKYLQFLFVLTIGSSYSFAQQSGKDSVSNVLLDTLSVSAPAGAPVYRASATRVWDIKNTRIALSFNRIEKTADAREWITLHPYFYATDTVELDAKGMKIDSVMLVNKKEVLPVVFTYVNNKLVVHFAKTYKMADTIELYLRYTAMPYGTSTGGSGAITDDRGLYFINTDNSIPHKPSMIWTQGETESNSHWMVTIDKPNTRTTTQVELTIPDSLTTLSNGALVKQVKHKDGMRTDIWKMDMPIQAYVVMFAVGKFTVIKDHWNKKEVNYYTEPEYAPYGKLIFKNTPEMMDYFSQITGVSYPWNKYSQVVVRDYVSGAMENTSAALFGEFMNGNARELADHDNEDVVSHELFHEWFGDYVTCESWSNITVNESFANYGEQLWRGHKYGKAAGDELAFSDLQIYLSSSQMNDPQLVRFYYDSREDVFDAISYNKGGAILRYMNSLMGDDAFHRAMNIYLTKNALHSAEAQNWRLAVEEATGQDWNWFFNQWYLHAGHPVLKVNYDYNDSMQKLVVTITQDLADSTYMYQLPLKAAVIYNNELTVVDWNITKRKETLMYPYKNGVAPVIIPDYTHVLPGTVKDNKKPAQWLTAYLQSNDYISKRLAIGGASKQMSDSSSQVAITMALSDTLASIRQYVLAKLKDAQSDKYHKRWTTKVMELATTDKDIHVRASAFEVLGEWKVAAAKPAMLAAVGDSSYAIAGAALTGIDRQDKDTAYLLARKLLNTNPKADLQGTTWKIIGKKAADDDIALYEKYAPYFFGTKKFNIAMSLGNYLKSVKSDNSFERGVRVYRDLIFNESMKQLKSPFFGFMVQAAITEKDKTTADNKDDAETAKKRLAVMKDALRKIDDAEKDEDAKKEMDKMLEKDL